MALSVNEQSAKVLWEHPSPHETHMYKFKKFVESKRKLNLPTYHDLHEYSVSRRSDFWSDVWQEVALVHSGNYSTVVDESARIDSLPQWFTGTRLNFAENILYTSDPRNPSIRATKGKEDSKVAIVEVREGNTSSRSYTWGQLRARVSHFSSSLAASGVRKGDRVAVVASNSIDTLCVFLGATSLGAMFSSSSADMGTKGILDRLTQIRPKWVFVDDGSVYNGKTSDLRGKMREIVEGMKGVAEFQGLISMPRFAEARDTKGMQDVMTLNDFLKSGREGEIAFERVGFKEGFLIVYSSGTTGQPKCIVHATGGVLMNAFKEGKLHREMSEDSVCMQYTTTGWIMYLASVQTLMFGARLIMYDGSPFIPKVDTFMRLAGEQKVTHLGISPKLLSTLQASLPQAPKTYIDLSSLRVVTSTGMVLPPSLFRYFYSAFPSRAHLANIAGGTDLAGAFGDCTALLPVYDSGGCQCRSLGMDVRVYDSTIESRQGKEVPNGSPGEVVAVRSFPNMPVGFWGDDDGKKYFSAYYERFDNVWTHGDFVVLHPEYKSLIFLGRADGVLNPSGVRFGSAEIYSVIETRFPKEIADSICVGQRRPQDVDESVMLFVQMRPGMSFSMKLVDDIKARVGEELSKRHVPKWIFETWNIPTTVNLKKVELPVKRLVSGEVVKPSGTLANPESLEYYKQFARVEELVKERNPAGKRDSKL